MRPRKQLKDREKNEETEGAERVIEGSRGEIQRAEKKHTQQMREMPSNRERPMKRQYLATKRVIES